jgi:hypothetical protein
MILHEKNIGMGTLATRPSTAKLSLLANRACYGGHEWATERPLPLAQAIHSGLAAIRLRLALCGRVARAGTTVPGQATARLQMRCFDTVGMWKLIYYDYSVRSTVRGNSKELNKHQLLRLETLRPQRVPCRP